MSIHEPIHSNPSSSSSPRSTAPKIRSAQTAFFELVEGVALYALCITVPTLFGIAIKYYENIHHRHSLYTSWITEYYDTFVNILSSSLCHDDDEASSRDFKYFARSASCRFVLWMTKSSNSNSNSASASVSGKKQRYLTDMHIVGIVSLCLAIIRIAIFYLLIPEYLAPQQLKAIMRCKSSHVLSSASLRNFESPKKKTAKEQPRSAFKTNKGNRTNNNNRRERQGNLL